MREQTLGNAWANVTGRRVASLTTIVIVSSLMAALVALLVPLHDVRANLRAQYDDPSWRSTFLVEGIAGASEPMGPAEIAALGHEPGVTSVTPVETAQGPSGTTWCSCAPMCPCSTYPSCRDAPREPVPARRWSAVTSPGRSWTPR